MKPLTICALLTAIISPRLACCQTTKDWKPQASEVTAAEQVSEPVLRSHIRFLASDLLEGRGPASRGDELARLYIATELESLGVRPAAQGGSWFQPVPLVGVTSTPPQAVDFRKGDQVVTLKHHDDMMLTSGKPAESVEVKNAELVFVGYGIQAPEYQWDDFKDTDVRGKILVFMNNDPESDPTLFAGRRRLYYGRWDYKYEMAAKQGAAGALIIHTTPSAGYPFQVVQTSWSGEDFELANATGPRTNLRGWLTENAATKLMQLAGKDLDALRANAQVREFRPIPLGITMSAQLSCHVREQNTGNVIGVLPGSDPELSREHVIFMAHHDHLGLAAARDAEGDNIYNGAIDNASGVATMLTIARAICSLPVAPKRSIMFAAVGAEEQGLLGSKYMAEHPPIPAGFMAAVINIDGINFLGKTHDVNVIGDGKSTLDSVLKQVASYQGRTVTPDHFPDRGYYYRSDQFSMAKVGVPGVYLHSGVNIVGKPDGWGKQQLEEWTEKTYHQPSDEYSDKWDLAGAIEDAQLLMHIGLTVSDMPAMPSWTPGDEFEAARKKAISTRDN